MVCVFYSASSQVALVSANTVAYGSSLSTICQVSVSGGDTNSPSGLVTLYADGASAATASLSSSNPHNSNVYNVSLTWSPSSSVNTSVGHSLMCAYAGDSLSAGSANSSSQSVSVTAFSGAMVTLAYSSNVYDNTTILVTATVSVSFTPVVFSGSFSLISINASSNAVTVLGSNNNSLSSNGMSGSVVFTVSTNQVALLGVNSLVAEYTGDSRISAVNSSGYFLTILPG